VLRRAPFLVDQTKPGTTCPLHVAAEEGHVDVSKILIKVSITVTSIIFLSTRHALYAIALPSVRLSVTRVDQSKMVEVRIMQLSLQSSPIHLVFVI